jgi:predicted RNA-binding protein with PUA-like domain
MPRSYWLIKSEPSKYSFEQLVRDGKTRWDGVRNFAARNNLRTMKEGDLCLYYHSNEGKLVAGVARVAREAYPDPTAKEGDFSDDEVLGKMMIFRHPRLSVVPVTKEEFDAVLRLAR